MEEIQSVSGPEQSVLQSVLVVEDDPDIRECLQDVLEREDYDVHTAPNGCEALLELARMAKPALVLLDWMMPVMSGPQFLDRLRNDSATADLPVVIVTATELQVPEGAAAVLQKPFDLVHLRAVARDAIAHALSLRH